LLLLVAKRMRKVIKNLFSLVVVVFSLSLNVNAEQFLGRLNGNPYDSESVSNPYGRYGNPHSSDSVNNPYRASNPYSGNELYLFGED